MEQPNAGETQRSKQAKKRRGRGRKWREKIVWTLGLFIMTLVNNACPGSRRHLRILLGFCGSDTCLCYFQLKETRLRTSHLATYVSSSPAIYSHLSLPHGPLATLATLHFLKHSCLRAFAFAVLSGMSFPKCLHAGSLSFKS